MSYTEIIILMILFLLFSITIPIYCVCLSTNFEPHKEEELLIK